MWSRSRCRRAMGCACLRLSEIEKGRLEVCLLAAGKGVILSNSDAFGVALVDTEVLSLAGCWGGESYLADEAFGIVAFYGAVISTAVGAGVCVLWSW
jgi:hypothetical protein